MSFLLDIISDRENTIVEMKFSSRYISLYLRAFKFHFHFRSSFSLTVELVIHSVQVSDTGSYVCLATKPDNSGQIEPDRIERKIKVRGIVKFNFHTEICICIDGHKITILKRGTKHVSSSHIGCTL